MLQEKLEAIQKLTEIEVTDSLSAFYCVEPMENGCKYTCEKVLYISCTLCSLISRNHVTTLRMNVFISSPYMKDHSKNLKIWLKNTSR